MAETYMKVLSLPAQGQPVHRGGCPKKKRSRIIRIYQLKPGDRFSFVPAEWHGPGVVTESYGTRILLPLGFRYQNTYPKSRDGKHRVSGTWTIKFANNKVVNPPGVSYDHPERKVRLLRRGRRRQ